MKTMKELKFCYDKTLFQNKTFGNASRAVWEKSKYWEKGQTIKVFMINGSIDEQNEMKQAFSEISSHTSLNFSYVTNRYESDIRVSFNKGWGSYSYLGTDALFIPKEYETINIGWRGLDVCRHEALHSIGALHEHQNPVGGIEWDEAEVIKDLSGHPNYWTEEEIRHNVLNKIDIATVDASEYDPDSVMLYYFPPSWTKNNISSNDNPDFSEKDIEYMKKIYEIDITAPLLTLNGDTNITLLIGDTYIEEGATAIDNIDGDISNNIVISGNVDTSTEGLYYITYTIIDNAGNKSEKIRTIMVQSKLELKVLLKELFPTKYRLSRLTETQILLLAEKLDITATKEDLKADTVDKVWSHL